MTLEPTVLPDLPFPGDLVQVQAPGTAAWGLSSGPAHLVVRLPMDAPLLVVGVRTIDARVPQLLVTAPGGELGWINWSTVRIVRAGTGSSRRALDALGRGGARRATRVVP